MGAARRDLQLRRLGAAAAGVAVVLGLLATIGWAFGVPRLHSLPVLGKTTGDAAVACVLLGVAVWLNVAGRWARPAAALAAVAAAIGLAALAERASGVSLAVDHLPAGARTGQMVLETAAATVLAGTAVAAWALRPRAVRWSQGAALGLGAVVLLALLGQLLGAGEGVIAAWLRPPSLQTTIGLLALAAALVLAQPRAGLLALLRRDSAGGVLGRRLAGPVIVLPALLAWASLDQDRRSVLGTDAAVALYAATLTLVFGWLFWEAARRLDRYDETLRLGESRWRAIFESDRVGVAIRDADARLLDCNERFAQILGRGRDALIGTRPDEILSAEQARIAMSGYIDAGQTGRGVRHEQVVTRPDGRDLQARVNIYPVLDRDGKLAYQVTMIEDVTDLRRMEQELAHTRRLESIARLAGGVAHELNNKLAVVLGFADLISGDLGPDDPLRESVEQIRLAAGHSASLTHDLLLFGRRQEIERRPVPASEISTSLLGILRPALGEGIELVVRDDSRGAEVLADRAQLEQVLVNLALNARDAMPDGGRLTITTSLSRATGDPGSRWVQVTVADTGVGMEREVRERVFEPFFTTKEFGQGSGLGLSTALGIVTQMGGSIEVESRPGAGTTVLVRLPELARGAAGAPDGPPAVRAGERPGAAPGEEPGADGRERQGADGGERPGADGGEPRSGRAQPAAGLRVLLVEDEDQVRRLVSVLLGDAGHSVVSVAGGLEALQMLGERAHEVDLLLTDLVLGDIHGDELALAARELRPGLPVVYMSGYGGRSPDGALPGAAVLAKPFTEHELDAALRRAVASR